MLWDMIAVFVIGAAFFFLLTNGLHDASSVVATMIGCGAGLPLQTVMFAAVLEMTGALLGGSAVAHTVVKMIKVTPGHILLLILLVAVMSAAIWNLLTWKLGLPSSSTHALVGGVIGAVCVATGPGDIVWGLAELMGENHELTGIVKVVASLVISPVVGFLAAFLLQKVMSGILKNSNFTKTNRRLKGLQWVLVGMLAYSHGANDTQKIMGLAMLALMAAGKTAVGVYDIPLWLRFSVGGIMCIGILCGGWSIMKTLGRGIFTLRPIHSFDSLLSSGSSLYIATMLGAPVSTTHLVAGSIMGVGAADEYRMVNWKIGQDMMIAWFVTIPASAAFAAFMYVPLRWVVVNVAGGIF